MRVRKRRKMRKSKGTLDIRRIKTRAGGGKRGAKREGGKRSPRRDRRTKMKRLTRKGREVPNKRVRRTEGPPRSPRFESLNRGGGSKAKEGVRRRETKTPLIERKREVRQSKRKRRETRFKVQKRKRRRTKTPRNGTTSRMMKRIKRTQMRRKGEGEPSSRSIRKSAPTKGKIKNKKRFLRRPPVTKRETLQRPKTRKKAGAKSFRVSSERKGPVERNPQKDRTGVKRKRRPRERKARFQAGLERINRKEGDLAFRRAQRKRPMTRPFGNNDQRPLYLGRSGGHRGVGRPNSQVISKERKMNRRRKRGRKIIYKDKKKRWAKNGSLGDPKSAPKGAAERTFVSYSYTAIGEKGLDPAHETRGKTDGQEFVKKGGMPNRIESTGEIDSSQDRALGRLRRMEAIGDRLRKNKNLIGGGPTATEASLEGREERR